eukprot:scaffold3964_cov126-Isochrysis_galbana.AAC.2
MRTQVYRRGAHPPARPRFCSRQPRLATEPYSSENMCTGVAHPPQMVLTADWALARRACMYRSRPSAHPPEIRDGPPIRQSFEPPHGARFPFSASTAALISAQLPPHKSSTSCHNALCTDHPPEPKPHAREGGKGEREGEGAWACAPGFLSRQVRRRRVQGVSPDSAGRVSPGVTCTA